MSTMPISRAYAASFVVAGIALNVVAGRLAALTGVPGLYLDLSGTLLTALVLGPWWAATTGLLSNVVAGLIAGPVTIPFGLVNMAFGLVVGYLAEKGWTRSWIKTIATFIIACFVVSGTASLIVVFLFGGATGAPQDIIVFTLLSVTGWDLLAAVFIADIAGKPIDMFFEFVIAFAILRALPGEYKLRTPFKHARIEKREGAE